MSMWNEIGWVVRGSGVKARVLMVEAPLTLALSPQGRGDVWGIDGGAPSP